MPLTSHPDAASLYAQMREDRAENLAKIAASRAHDPALLKAVGQSLKMLGDRSKAFTIRGSDW